MRNIIFWCEFPERIKWKNLQKVLKSLDMKIKIYVPCKALAQYLWWKQEVGKLSPNVDEINVWPILDKKDGYWFSGFTEVHNIDKLEEFKGTKIKIDLEMPPPYYEYSFRFILKYTFMYLLKKAPNTRYLKDMVFKINKDSDILVNEFPCPRFLLKRWGCYIPAKKGIKKQMMAYSTMFPRFWIKHYIKKRFRKDKNLSVSLGLIGPGILKTEPTYDSIKQFEKDLKMVKKIGIKNVAIYSIDSIMKRPNPEPWLKAIREFSRQ